MLPSQIMYALSLPNSVLLSGGSIKALCKHRGVKALLHETRVFLRSVLIISEAERRPKDFGGLEVNWDESRSSRELMYALQL